MIEFIFSIFWMLSKRSSLTLRLGVMYFFPLRTGKMPLSDNLGLSEKQLKRLSQELREQYGQIPWRRIAGLRDVLIHNYMGVDLDAVWVITQKDLPGVKENIDAILTQLNE